MGKVKDLTGLRFGKLLVLENCGSKKKCLCDCGKITYVDTNHLLTGHSKSCGCGNARYRRKALGISTSRLYSIYSGMKERCYNPKNIAYKWYGARGIKICDEWKKQSSVFLIWALNHGYEENLTIDRIDVNGNYCPENCRWITMKEQTRNTRNNRNITINNETKCLTDWCDLFKIKTECVYHYKKRYNVSFAETILKLKNHHYDFHLAKWVNND